MGLPPTAPLQDYWAGLNEYVATKNELQRRALGADLRRWRRNQTIALTQAFLIDLVGQPEQGEAWQRWFWFNHFNVTANKQQISAVLAPYLLEAIGQNLRGRFLDLLKAVTVHPAMLMYLDNVRNIKGRGNENQARELLELHTLGVGGGYVQADVVAAAEIMTGWGVTLRGSPEDMGKTTFNPRQHEDGEKRLLGRAFTADGERELPSLLEHLAAQPATARHIAQKLAIWQLGDSPRPEHVKRLADVYLQTGGQMPALWATVERIKSESARKLSANGMQPGKFKDPLRYVTSSAKLLLEGAPADNARPLFQWLRLLGQPMFQRGSPDGYPLMGSDWQSAGQLSQRVELAQAMVNLAHHLGEPNPIRQRLQRNPSESPSAARAMEGMTAANRKMVETAADPKLAWALLLASPSFMYA